MKTRTFYKVNESSDQIRTNIKVNNGFLIANELYTDRVVNSAIKNGRIDQGFINKHFTVIELHPSNTYWFFGARFETINDYSK